MYFPTAVLSCRFSTGGSLSASFPRIISTPRGRLSRVMSSFVKLDYVLLQVHVHVFAALYVPRVKPLRTVPLGFHLCRCTQLLVADEAVYARHGETCEEHGGQYSAGNRLHRALRFALFAQAEERGAASNRQRRGCPRLPKRGGHRPYMARPMPPQQPIRAVQWRKLRQERPPTTRQKACVRRMEAAWPQDRRQAETRAACTPGF